MSEIEVHLVDLYTHEYKHESIKIHCRQVPTVIKYKECLYLRMFSLGIPQYAKINYYLDLDKVKDESLEEVLSKE